MLQLNTIRAHVGATQKRKRLGRGSGSGLGQTAGKGDKGQLARTGGSVRPGFEGGQMPLYRRIPKRGFTSLAKKRIAVLNLSQLERLDPKEFKEISLATLTAAKELKGRYDQLAVLGTGDLSKNFHVKAHKISPSAQEKISKAGGKFEVIVAKKKPARYAKKNTANK